VARAPRRSCRLRRPKTKGRIVSSSRPSDQDDFLESAELYDAIYHFKNYQRESEGR
jgi:hypothetical protein